MQPACGRSGFESASNPPASFLFYRDFMGSQVSEALLHMDAAREGGELKPSPGKKMQQEPSFDNFLQGQGLAGQQESVSLALAVAPRFLVLDFRQEL